jgi:hypothetical protein
MVVCFSITSFNRSVCVELEFIESHIMFWCKLSTLLILFYCFQKTSLSQMLYLSDNLAYFPYQVQDEPLFIIHHIDIMISVSGTNLLQSFREVSLTYLIAFSLKQDIKLLIHIYVCFWHVQHWKFSVGMLTFKQACEPHSAHKIISVCPPLPPGFLLFYGFFA